MGFVSSPLQREVNLTSKLHLFGYLRHLAELSLSFGAIPGTNTLQITQLLCTTHLCIFAGIEQCTYNRGHDCSTEHSLSHSGPHSRYTFDGQAKSRLSGFAAVAGLG